MPVVNIYIHVHEEVCTNSSQSLCSVPQSPPNSSLSDDDKLGSVLIRSDEDHSR